MHMWLSLQHDEPQCGSAMRRDAKLTVLAMWGWLRRRTCVVLSRLVLFGGVACMVSHGGAGVCQSLCTSGAVHHTSSATRLSLIHI